MPELVPIDRLKEYVGKEIGLSDWLHVTQERINAFADCTEDHQWIHVDTERAKKGPFGTTIAHGYLTLSFLPHFSAANRVLPAGIKMAINYGTNKVRFITPVKVGSKVRNHAVLKAIEDKGGGRILMTVENTIEIEGERKPALVAECLSLFFT
jgi:acyl dehydratase